MLKLHRYERLIYLILQFAEELLFARISASSICTEIYRPINNIEDHLRIQSETGQPMPDEPLRRNTTSEKLSFL